MDKLKENIALQAELLDLKASKSGNARGVVLEAKIDKGKGPVATVLVTSGELKKERSFYLRECLWENSGYDRL